MLNFSRNLRQNLTNAECLLWSRLRRRQLNDFKFRRQHMIGSYICDFVCVEARVVIELDGSQHLDHAPYDAHRDRFLRSKGYRVLRFWNGDVLNQTGSVMETIFEALHREEMDGRFD
ncbi:endonuclease domain-containing protein [Reyranella sp.]|uniref:endonuclease domain-containing protein n=1 Tax=Reyranella sp. TaxID=1929291 RepID=UPI003D10709B